MIDTILMWIVYVGAGITWLITTWETLKDLAEQLTAPWRESRTEWEDVKTDLIFLCGISSIFAFFILGVRHFIG